ncbi:MAG: DUF924 domain-containing protein [Gammaproteobacteria bacterium]|nr:DUF924 domain-containing protein [Gammaproteobacteria bacterium]MDH5694215.1 DUF924 domain-containing protein [Gammaproteobacteria bacterium]
MNSAIANTTPEEILSFWFSKLVSKHWFNSTPELDSVIKERFEEAYSAALAGKLDHWLESPESALALVIILDQFPLNMYRGEARSFESENKAVEVALKSISQQHHLKIDKDKVGFLVLPFMHSESMKMQDVSVKLFTQLGLDENLRYAEHHRKIVENYGRFPHRNEILGRASTPEEIKYLNSPDAFHG